MLGRDGGIPRIERRTDVGSIASESSSYDTSSYTSQSVQSSRSGALLVPEPAEFRRPPARLYAWNPTREQFGRVPGNRVIEFGSSSHYFFLENPVEASRMMLDFVASLP